MDNSVAIKWSTAQNNEGNLELQVRGLQKSQRQMPQPDSFGSNPGISAESGTDEVTEMCDYASDVSYECFST